ncbi:hypothetical protein PV325_004931, partial [Microctonus aethiopoides]
MQVIIVAKSFDIIQSVTFHTPSFGDEDFDIPAIHPHQQHQQHQQQQHHQQQHDPMHGYQSQ